MQTEKELNEEKLRAQQQLEDQRRRAEQREAELRRELDAARVQMNAARRVSRSPAPKPRPDEKRELERRVADTAEASRDEYADAEGIPCKTSRLLTPKRSRRYRSSNSLRRRQSALAVRWRRCKAVMHLDSFPERIRLPTAGLLALRLASEGYLVRARDQLAPCYRYSSEEHRPRAAGLLALQHREATTAARIDRNRMRR